MLTFWREIDGHNVYVARRRYGTKTFTWLEVKVSEGEFVSLGDPWPCITPSLASVREEIKRRLPQFA